MSLSTSDSLSLLVDRLEGEAAVGEWEPYPWQVPPASIPAHGLWLINGGRGIGKTDGCAHYVIDHVNGPACDTRPGRSPHRIAIVAPTLGDAVEACVTGPSGLKAYDPSCRMVQGTGGTYVRWPNGSEAKLFGASTPDDVERLRAGGNRCLVWAEEIAAWRHLGPCWDHASFGLRVGDRAHFVGASTPKPRPEYKALLKAPTTVVTGARTEDADRLPAEVKQKLLDKYGGTRLGRQELGGELLEDVEGALWTLTMIDLDRVPAAPDMARVVVGVDPAVTSGENADESGIIVAGSVGIGATQRFYVLADLTGRYSPGVFAEKVALAYDAWNADGVVVETNQGGEHISHTIRSYRADIPVVGVHAKRGKALRAGPVAGLYEQHRVAHAGTHTKLEDQMTSWVPGEGDSPDRIDALVHAVTHLAGSARGPVMRFTPRNAA